MKNDNVIQLNSERLLNVKQVSEMIGLQVGTLNRARLTGAPSPPFCKIGSSVRYRLSSVLRWIESQEEHNSTSEVSASK